MIENWFSNKCMTLIGLNGRALVGDALEAAEQAIAQCKAANEKIWTDRNGNFYHKERRLFASAKPLIDSSGNQVRICGKMVKIKAKFCSRQLVALRRMRQNDRCGIRQLPPLRTHTESENASGYQ